RKYRRLRRHPDRLPADPAATPTRDRAGVSLKMRARGFTLLEMLVAVAIFAVVAALSYGGLIAIMQQYETTRDVQSRLQDIRRAVTLLERDLFQVRDRGIREAFQGDLLPPLRGGVSDAFQVEFTRGGWRNPAALPRATLQRVAWRIEDDTLYRLHWVVLDQSDR